MPLTAADVRNVAFSKPSRFRTGYNSAEVDAFLELVGSELERMAEQLADLQSSAEHCRRQHA